MVSVEYADELEVWSTQRFPATSGIESKGLLVGSVSHKINHLANCTCITVK